MREDFQIHQPAKQSVKFPKTVVAAWTVTNQSKLLGLSKKCQVQAHMALTKAGNIPEDKARQEEFPVTSPYFQTKAIATIHSITLETWIIQVGIDRAFIIYRNL